MEKHGGRILYSNRNRCSKWLPSFFTSCPESYSRQGMARTNCKEVQNETSHEWNVQDFSGMFQCSPECSRVLRNVPVFSRTFLSHYYYFLRIPLILIFPDFKSWRRMDLHHQSKLPKVVAIPEVSQSSQLKFSYVSLSIADKKYRAHQKWGGKTLAWIFCKGWQKQEEEEK